MQSKKVNTIGLDISTSITGISLFQDDQCVLNEYIDTRNKNKYPNLYDKARKIESRMLEISREYDVNQVFIEQSLFVFKSGRSSAQILSKLSRFNGMVSWISCYVFGVDPCLISAATARKECGIKIKRGEKSKDVCLKYVLDDYDQFVVEYTRNGNVKPGILDKSDSYVIAKAGWEVWKKENRKF